MKISLDTANLERTTDARAILEQLRDGRVYLGRLLGAEACTLDFHNHRTCQLAISSTGRIATVQGPGITREYDSDALTYFVAGHAARYGGQPEAGRKTA